MSKKMYLVDYWEPFPRSEYGGLQCVIAENDEECAGIIEREVKWIAVWEQEAARALIVQAVNEALKYELAGDPPAGLVKSFET